MGQLCSRLRRRSARRNQAKVATPEDVHAVFRAVSRNDFLGLLKHLDAFSPEQRRRIFQDQTLHQSVHRACERDNFRMMEYILKFAPHLVDVTNSEGLPVLYRATQQSNTKAVRLVLKHGADVTRVQTTFVGAESRYEPLIHIAMNSNDLVLIRLVVEAGTDVNALSWDGKNCLQKMTKRCSWKIVKYLLAHGVRGVYESAYDSPALTAFAHGNIVVFKNLWKDFAKTPDAVESCTQFHRRATGCYVLQELLEKEGRISDAIFYLEVVGAKLILDHKLQQGINRWRKAMALRWRDPNSPRRKSPLHNSLGDVVGTTEVLTMADLELLPLDSTALLIQAAYAVYRHIGFGELYAEALVCLARDMMMSGRLVLALRILDQATQETNEQESKVYILLLQVYIGFKHRVERDQHVPFTHLLCFVKSCNRRLQLCSCGTADPRPPQQGFADSCFRAECLTRLIVRGISLLLSLVESATPAEKVEMRSHVDTFLAAVSEHKHINLFHCENHEGNCVNSALVKYLVCSSHTLAQENNTAPIHLAKSIGGETPLHACARYLSQKELVDDDVLQCFLEYGAHLCTRDQAVDGERIADILVRRGILAPGEVLPSLQCLAAREAAKLPSEMLPDNQAMRDFILQH